MDPELDHRNGALLARAVLSLHDTLMSKSMPLRTKTYQQLLDLCARRVDNDAELAFALLQAFGAVAATSAVEPLMTRSFGILSSVPWPPVGLALRNLTQPTEALRVRSEILLRHLHALLANERTAALVERAFVVEDTPEAKRHRGSVEAHEGAPGDIVVISLRQYLVVPAPAKDYHKDDDSEDSGDDDDSDADEAKHRARGSVVHVVALEAPDAAPQTFPQHKVRAVPRARDEAEARFCLLWRASLQAASVTGLQVAAKLWDRMDDDAQQSALEAAEPLLVAMPAAACQRALSAVDAANEGLGRALADALSRKGRKSHLPARMQQPTKTVSPAPATPASMTTASEPASLSFVTASTASSPASPAAMDATPRKPVVAAMPKPAPGAAAAAAAATTVAVVSGVADTACAKCMYKHSGDFRDVCAVCGSVKPRPPTGPASDVTPAPTTNKMYPIFNKSPSKKSTPPAVSRNVVDLTATPIEIIDLTRDD